jgi:excisionase family DNA binding protein
MDTLLRAGDVAVRLNISKSLAYDLIRRREIPAVVIGRSVRVREEDLEKFVKASVVPANRPLEQLFG